MVDFDSLLQDCMERPSAADAALYFTTTIDQLFDEVIKDATRGYTRHERRGSQKYLRQARIAIKNMHRDARPVIAAAWHTGDYQNGDVDVICAGYESLFNLIDDLT